MINLTIVAGFVRALGSVAGLATPQNAERISTYANKAADLINLAEQGRLGYEHAQAKLESDTKTMEQWVAQGYEPGDADFDALEGRINELHDRYQQSAQPETPE